MRARGLPARPRRRSGRCLGRARPASSPATWRTISGRPCSLWRTRGSTTTTRSRSAGRSDVLNPKRLHRGYTLPDSFGAPDRRRCRRPRAPAAGRRHRPAVRRSRRRQDRVRAGLRRGRGHRPRRGQQPHVHHRPGLRRKPGAACRPVPARPVGGRRSRAGRVAGIGGPRLHRVGRSASRVGSRVRCRCASTTGAATRGSWSSSCRTEFSTTRCLDDERTRGHRSAE